MLLFLVKKGRILWLFRYGKVNTVLLTGISCEVTEYLRFRGPPVFNKALTLVLRGWQQLFKYAMIGCNPCWWHLWSRYLMSLVSTTCLSSSGIEFELTVLKDPSISRNAKMQVPTQPCSILPSTSWRAISAESVFRFSYMLMFFLTNISWIMAFQKIQVSLLSFSIISISLTNLAKLKQCWFN